MNTVRYLVTGFPGAFKECHRWLVRVTYGVWPLMLCPGHRAWAEVQYLRQLSGPEGR
jgi:hypothetical protein